MENQSKVSLRSVYTEIHHSFLAKHTDKFRVLSIFLHCTLFFFKG